MRHNDKLSALEKELQYLEDRRDWKEWEKSEPLRLAEVNKIIVLKQQIKTIRDGRIKEEISRP